MARLVPLTGPFEPVVPERLDELERLTAHLNGDEVERFRSSLLGAACAQLGPLQWESSLAIGIERFNVWSHHVAHTSTEADAAPSVL